ncbi:BMP family ABC transporter substrate-binding protein [Fodinicurvata sp. EGI_FJ10296]|uniref:BMP family lipoprotein n=1 Tax=Fodinicurvata sp. EGI_FJ10296 TaxID=3231908 RepID=UPI0034564ECD
MKKLAASVLAFTASMAVAQADEISPAVVYDMGGKFDRSFNEGVYNGVEQFREETGIDYREFEVTNEGQREQALERMARAGSDIVIAVGFAQAPPLEDVAARYPDTMFTIIDAVVDAPNVQSIVFKEHEGSFLVGVLAAMASETGAVGFIGGMDIPLIRNFECGYEQGAVHQNPDIEVIANMTGTTPAAWNDPARGGELARSQFDRGADVIFAAAGGTGVGVYQAAEDTGNLAIGVDSNQNHLHPGTMLTSMVKRVDVAAYNAFTDAMNGDWEPGVLNLGLAEEGVGWALDEHNEDLITDEMRDRVEEVRDSIIAGDLNVVSYHENNACEY